MKVQKTGADGKKNEQDVQIKNDKPNNALIYQVVRAQQLSRRQGSAATKTRGMVRGGGKKPWRQKGTGRARIGSIRAPHWTGGGVVFGPHPKNWSVGAPKKMRRRALADAFSARIVGNDVLIVTDFGITAGKTKEAVALLNNLEIDGKILVILAKSDALIGRAFSNLNSIVVERERLNVEDALWADKILVAEDSWNSIEELVG